MLEGSFGVDNEQSVGDVTPLSGVAGSIGRYEGIGIIGGSSGANAEIVSASVWTDEFVKENEFSDCSNELSDVAGDGSAGANDDAVGWDSKLFRVDEETDCSKDGSKGDEDLFEGESILESIESTRAKRESILSRSDPALCWGDRGDSSDEHADEFIGVRGVTDGVTDGDEGEIDIVKGETDGDKGETDGAVDSESSLSLFLHPWVFPCLRPVSSERELSVAEVEEASSGEGIKEGAIAANSFWSWISRFCFEIADSVFTSMKTNSKLKWEIKSEFASVISSRRPGSTMSLPKSSLINETNCSAFLPEIPVCTLAFLNVAREILLFLTKPLWTV